MRILERVALKGIVEPTWLSVLEWYLSNAQIDLSFSTQYPGILPSPPPLPPVPCNQTTDCKQVNWQQSCLGTSSL